MARDSRCQIPRYYTISVSKVCCDFKRIIRIKKQKRDHGPFSSQLARLSRSFLAWIRPMYPHICANSQAPWESSSRYEYTQVLKVDLTFTFFTNSDKCFILLVKRCIGITTYVHPRLLSCRWYLLQESIFSSSAEHCVCLVLLDFLDDVSNSTTSWR